MFTSIIASLFAASTLFQRTAASPIQATSTSELKSRAVASTIVYASSFLGDLCLSVQVGPDGVNTAAIQAQAKVLLGNTASVQICLTALGGSVPSCNDGGIGKRGTGCGFTCLPGYTKTSTGCTQNNGPSQLPRRRQLAPAPKKLCPVTNETACPLSGSAALTKTDIDTHSYACQDLSSDVEACGACGNVCTGLNEGCWNGQCVALA